MTERPENQVEPADHGTPPGPGSADHTACPEPGAADHTSCAKPEPVDAAEDVWPTGPFGTSGPFGPFAASHPARHAGSGEPTPPTGPSPSSGTPDASDPPSPSEPSDASEPSGPSEPSDVSGPPSPSDPSDASGPGGGGPTPPPSGPGPEPGPAPDDGEPPRRGRHWLRWTALGASFLVLAAGGVGYAVYSKLDGNINTDPSVQRQLEKYESQRPPAGSRGTQNILLIGSDNRSGGNAAYGHERGQRSDTTILLHLPADRHSATGVSIPRDLVTHVPECRTRSGRTVAAHTGAFNSAFETGGAACTIRAIEGMTHLRVDHYVIIDFSGFKRMVDAVDGVEVCVPQAVHDKEAHLNLRAGRQTLDGEQALGYVRVRKSLGDGSDTQRMGRQQRFLAALVKKMRSNGVLLNPGKLYPVLDAATASLTTDQGLASLRGLYGLVRGTRSITSDHVQFLTVPRRAYRLDSNRDELAQPAADQLFDSLRANRPVRVRPTSGTEGSSPSAGASTAPSASPSGAGPSGSPSGASPAAAGGSAAPSADAPASSGPPTFGGTTAGRGVCS